MKPVYVYSVENSRGEFFVSHTRDIDVRMIAHRTESVSVIKGIKYYLGSDNIDEWTVRVHDVFGGCVGSKEAMRQEEYWKALIGAKNVKSLIQHSITGNERIT